MDFYNAYSQGFARVAACTHHASIGDPAANAASVLGLARQCHDDGVALAVFPELTLSGYSIEDILLQDVLLDAVEHALVDIVAASADLLPVLVIGAPLRYRHRIYNTAVVIHRGALLGVAPKSYLPTYREFYERRQVAPGDDERGTIRIAGLEAPFGADLLFAASDLPGFVLHVEICEDMFVPVPPSAEAALAGATVLANLSGSPITIGRADDRSLLARSASLRCLAAYVYAAAGEGESTTDLAWDGQTMIWEHGVMLAQSERFPKGSDAASPTSTSSCFAQSGCGWARLTTTGATTGPSRNRSGGSSFGWTHRSVISACTARSSGSRLCRPIRIGCSRTVTRPTAFRSPGSSSGCARCTIPKVVIGVSGGLDSTHALIVAARAMDREDRPRSDILAFTLPGFATGERTKRNAVELCRALGVTFAEIDITETAKLMLTEMDHPFSRGEKVYDVTFENVQAGLRTDYLFRLANQRGGIVLGTGDLSELGLGWSTYGVGDQMSHYNVNAGVPKTLIQHLIRWVISSNQFPSDVDAVLQSVLDTEITPELVPTGEEEELQSSEAKVGPFALQDFSLFQVLRYGFRPSKIAFLAWHAWSDAEQGNWPPGYPESKRPSYSLKEIRHWLQIFVQRFYSFSQFKRSALPNGPKVSHGGSLSPRGDWRAPSDMSARAWLDAIEREVPEE